MIIPVTIHEPVLKRTTSGFAARCDEPGHADQQTLPRGTPSMAAAAAKRQGWVSYLDEVGQLKHRCATCQASKEGEQ